MSTLTSMPVPAHQDSSFKRKRSTSRSPARSPSPPRHRAKFDLPPIDDIDPVRRRERERQLAMRLAEQELEKEKKEANPSNAVEVFNAQKEFDKLAAQSKSGGRYIPPARLRAMQAEAAAKDKSSTEYQRLSWDALRKSITGIVNRVNVGNIKHVVPELFSENLIRGRALFARSVMKAQAASLPYTPVFAALVAIINTKLPQVGELVLHRLLSQFRRSFKRNDKILCHSTTTFVAHLVNQTVANEIIALQILILLLERPTDDSVEIAVGFMREVGAFLAENSPKANATIFEQFRVVLNEGAISQRVQFMVEVLMQVRKDKYKDNPILPEGLDLVPEEDQITHNIGLDDELQVQEGLNVFKLDSNFLENEEKYSQIKAEILGEDDSSEDSGSEESDDEEGEAPVEDKPGIEDQTGTNLVNLRRMIYLTIMNSLNFEEAVHKLMKINIEEGEEVEMCNMIIECCSQERSYSTFYGLVGERFSKLNRNYTAAFEQAFRNYYDTIHRYETNRLRNIARFFGHLLASDSLSWAVLDVVKMNEDETTSSSRIFVKILCGEMMEEMGLKGLVERLKDPEVRDICRNMFPLDNPKNTRFSINYFTSVGLGAVTEEMREHLKNAPKLIMEQRRALLEEEDSSSDSDSDLTSSDSDSGSDLNTDPTVSSPYSRRRRSSTPPRTRHRSTPRSPPRSRSRTPPRRRSPPPRRDVEDKRRTETPPRRLGRDDDSRSPPRRVGRDITPPRRGRREETPPRRGRRDQTPPLRDRRDETPPRRGGKDDMPPRRGRDDTPSRRNERDDTPLRRSGRDDTSPRRGRDDTPPRGKDGTSPRRRRDDTPPRRAGREGTPPRRREDPSPRRDGRDDTPPRRRRRDSYTPPRRSRTPPRRRNDSPPRRSRY